MGAVYQAEDLRNGSLCALKVLHQEPGNPEASERRFRREFRAAQRLSHPNIARVFDLAKEDSTLFYSMEYVRGIPLTEFFRAGAEDRPVLNAINDPRRIESMVSVFSQICSALSYIHGNLIVHRDIKPDNILITGPRLREDEGRGEAEDKNAGPHEQEAARIGEKPAWWLIEKEPVAKILDFGLARHMNLDTKITKTGIILGTVDYMSPEQALGAEIDLRSDLYSLGVVMYQLMAGHLPFEGAGVLPTLMKHAYEEPPAVRKHNPAILPVLEEIIHRLLNKDPGERFQNAESLGNVLKAGVLGIEGKFRDEVGRLSETDEKGVSMQLFSPKLVGREHVMRSLRTALSSTARGTGKFLLLSGESGVGKTRLLQELRKYGPLEGVTRYEGACHKENPIAFMPYAAILDQLATDLKPLDPAERKEFLPENPAVLADAIPSFLEGSAANRSAVESMSPEQKKFEFFRSVTTLLRKASKRKPMMLLLDDVHWADMGTVELSAHLARNIIFAERELKDPEASGNLSILATSAENLFENSHPASRILLPLKEEGLLEEYRLERLGRNEIQGFVRSMSEGLPQTQGFFDWVIRESRGNPFLAIEAIRLFVSGGGPRAFSENDSPPTSQPEQDGAEVNVPVQGGLSDILDIRFGLKACVYMDVLSAAAVLGTEFQFPILKSVTLFSEDELLDILDRLLKEKLIEEPWQGNDRFRFGHSRIRDAALMTLPLKKKKKLHESAGKALETIPGSFGESTDVFIAEHFYEAENVGAAIGYLMKAGNYHKNRFNSEGALSCYLRVLEFLDLSRERDNEEFEDLRSLARFRAGEIYRTIGDYNKSINHFSVVLGELFRDRCGEMRIDALNKLGDVFLRKGDYVEAEKCILKSLELSSSSRNKAKLADAVNTMGNIRWHLGDFEGSLEGFAAALELRRALSDEPGVAVCLNNVGYVHLNRGRYSEALKFFEESLTLRKKIGDSQGSAQSMGCIGIILERQGNYRKALGYHEESLRIMRELGDRRGVAYSLLSLGNVHGGLGLYPKALAFFEQAMRIKSEIGDTRGIAMAMGNLGILYSRMGEFEEAEKWMKHSFEIAVSIGEKALLAYTTLSLAEVLLERGDFGRSLEKFEECVRLLRELGDKFGLCIALLGSAASSLGLASGDAAKPPAMEALELAVSMGTKELEARSCLLMGEAERSLDLLRRAVEISKAIENGEILYRSLFRSGLLLYEQGDIYEAVEFLSRSREIVENFAASLGARKDKFLKKNEILTFFEKIHEISES
jgi:serine/threonine protein kinase/tetratricopeptide (TPR) repeat protein